MVQKNTFYSISLSEPSNPQRLTPRLGLLREQTGVPLFVFFTEEVSRPLLSSILNIDGLENFSGPETIRKFLIPFFKSGGKFCYTLQLPISSEDGSLEQCLGADRGYQSKTGIHVLKLYYDMVDVISFPQVGFWDVEKAKQFWKILGQEFNEFQHYFFLMDLPIALSPETVEDFLPVGQKQIAAFSPFLFYRNEILPPSPVAAALIQKTDKEFGTHENPTLHSAPEIFETVETYPSPLASSLLEKKVNLFRKSSTGELKLWGAYTLADKFDFDFRFLSSQRTFSYFRETLEELCEPFLMEPLTSDIDSLVEVSLYSTLQSTLRRLNLENQFKVNVKILQQGTEDILQLNTHLRLPLSAEEISFSLLLRS